LKPFDSQSKRLKSESERLDWRFKGSDSQSKRLESESKRLDWHFQ